MLFFLILLIYLYLQLMFTKVTSALCFCVFPITYFVLTLNLYLLFLFFSELDQNRNQKALKLSWKLLTKLTISKSIKSPTCVNFANFECPIHIMKYSWTEHRLSISFSTLRTLILNVQNGRTETGGVVDLHIAKPSSNQVLLCGI